MNFFFKTYFSRVILILILLIIFLANISYGAVNIPTVDIFNSLFGAQATKETWQYIIVDYRLPKAITAVLTGVGLSVAGLLMQTFFRNPLAGPYVLGLSSGSSLGVALVILGSSVLPSFLSSSILSVYVIVFASCLGSLLVLVLVLLASQKLRDTNSVLIVGLMFSSFASAIVGVLTYFSTAEQLQKFTFWSMGNLGSLDWSSVLILFIAVFIGLILSFCTLKSLDALLLGERYAISLGLNFKKFRLLILIATSILAGSITAFVGPIAFVGLAVPHLAKMYCRSSSHYVLFFATIIIGAVSMLVCDMLSHVPGTEIILPINAVTSIVGSPIVIWLIINPRRQKSNFNPKS